MFIYRKCSLINWNSKLWLKKIYLNTFYTESAYKEGTLWNVIWNSFNKLQNSPGYTSDDIDSISRGTVKPLLFLVLTRWGMVTHLCVTELGHLSTDNGLMPVGCHIITRTKKTLSPSQTAHYDDVIMGAIASQITSLNDCLLNRLFGRCSK